MHMKIDNTDYYVIEGTDERYYISRCGKVWDSLNNTEVSQVLTGIPQYKYVNLQLPEGRKLKRVHRLVAETLISNPNNLKYVDHTDRDKLNNNVDNLRWVTRSENQRNIENNLVLDDGTFLIDWCSKYENSNYSYNQIIQYMKNYKKSIEDCILLYEDKSLYQKHKRKKNVFIEVNGEKMRIKKFRDSLGLPLRFNTCINKYGIVKALEREVKKGKISEEDMPENIKLL